MIFHSVGIVGAGIMGRGIAQLLAQRGIAVLLIDVSDEILVEARQSIVNSVKAAALVDPAVRADREAILERITTTTDYGKLERAEFVIENTTEAWVVKEPVYRALSTACGPDCILAANTSAISIGRIAAVTENPSRVIGMHFMNPAPNKSVVELIRAPLTSDATVAGANGLLKQVGRRGIVVGDRPGFVTNRVLMLTINEAIRLVEEGVASARDVDDIFVGCFAHAMGPLATADLIGLDTVLLSLRVLQESFDDAKFDASPLLEQMVEEDKLGRKRGEGFFSYGSRSRNR